MQARLKWKNGLMLVMASLVIPGEGNGQGTINFANYAAGVDAPITNAAGNQTRAMAKARSFLPILLAEL